MKRHLISLSQDVRRYVFAALSVLCVFIGNAQTSIAEQLEYVIYEEQDFAKGQQLYNNITSEDIKSMPDSVLFNYHSLGGYINSEIPNHAKAIEHLEVARTLCETKLGTHTVSYMEIMKGLGDEYLETEETEKALEIFQEAIVKSMAARNYAGHAFGNLINGVATCYEQLGWFNEIPNHYMDAWSFWDKDETPLETHTYFPLWNLEQFYRRYGMYDKALAVSDKIIEFIETKGGKNHPELCEALYMRGNVFREAKKGQDAIATYERALAIAKNNPPSDSGLLGMIYGNLIVTLADEKEIQQCLDLLPRIKAFGIRTRDNKLYVNAVYSCALHLGQTKCFADALAFAKMIPTDGFSEAELNTITRMQETYQQDITLIAGLNDLLTSQKNVTVGSSEWYDISYDVSLAYYIQGDFSNSLKELEAIYNVYDKAPNNPSANPLYLLNSLLSLTTQLEENTFFYKYALAKFEILRHVNDAREDDIIDSQMTIVAGQLRCKQLDGIDERLNIIEEFYRTKYGKFSEEYATYLHNRGRAYQLQNNLDDAKATLLQAITIQNKVDGKPMDKTVKYYMEVIEGLGEI